MNTTDQTPGSGTSPDPSRDAFLDRQLDILRESTGSLSAPPELAPRLAAAFKAHHAGRRRRAWVAQWFAPGLALSASVGLSAWMVLAPMARPVADSLSPLSPVYTVAGDDAPFVALQPLARIEAEGEARIIQAEVPRAWLASYGVAVGPEVAGESLRAEMLVGSSGQPLAMRFLP